MVFSIQNSTGGSVTLGGTTYTDGQLVPIKDYIEFSGIKYTRNDIDGQNAGRSKNGTMIRDRVAIKGKWEVTLLNAINSEDAQAILELVKPSEFYIQTDFPEGTSDLFQVYTNNVPVNYYFNHLSDVYFTGITIPFVEV